MMKGNGLADAKRYLQMAMDALDKEMPEEDAEGDESGDDAGSSDSSDSSYSDDSSRSMLKQRLGKYA